MERSNFPHRNLDEDDEELLNGIWAGLETPDDRPDADSRDFDDVKRRIRHRVRRRWMSRAALAGSAAAIVAAVVLVVRQPGVLPEPDAFAQLQQMGVTVERPQVVMTADDGMRLVLENAARLERRSEGEVALHYNLVECDPAEDFAACSAATRFGDGNDLLLKVFGAERMERREGWVSRTYRQRTERPAYAFTVRKRAGEPVRLVTVLLPAADAAAQRVEAACRGDRLHVKIDGKRYNLK